MSRYIDADELLKMLPDDLPYKASVKRVFIQAPTADVVEVVRCKDCKMWESYENTSGAGYCHNKKFCFTYGAMLDKEFTPITMPDEFCSYGERREQNEG